jgi:hypothetical protein
VDQNGLKTVAYHGDDNLQMLRSIPAECVDFVYLDAPVFSSWAHGGSWAERAQADSVEDRWQGGVRAYLDWITAPLNDLNRILKPTGALFLVCDEAVGLYVRLVLDELFSKQDASNRMAWSKVNSGPDNHYVFYYCRSGKSAGRDGSYYTVIHREGRDDWSLVAFSFLQGQLRRSVSNHRPA